MHLVMAKLKTVLAVCYRIKSRRLRLWPQGHHQYRHHMTIWWKTKILFLLHYQLININPNNRNVLVFLFLFWRQKIYLMISMMWNVCVYVCCLWVIDQVRNAVSQSVTEGKETKKNKRKVPLECCSTTDQTNFLLDINKNMHTKDQVVQAKE